MAKTRKEIVPSSDEYKVMMRVKRLLQQRYADSGKFYYNKKGDKLLKTIARAAIGDISANAAEKRMKNYSVKLKNKGDRYNYLNENATGYPLVIPRYKPKKNVNIKKRQQKRDMLRNTFGIKNPRN